MSAAVTLSLAEANDWQLVLCFNEWLRFEAEAGTPIPRKDLVLILRANHIAGVQYWAPNEVNDESAAPVTEADMPQAEDDGGPFPETDDEEDAEFSDLPAATLESTWSPDDVLAHRVEAFYVSVLLELQQISKGFIHTQERTVRESCDLGNVVSDTGIGWSCAFVLSDEQELECRKVIIAAVTSFPDLSPLLGLRVRHVKNILFDSQRLVLEWRPSVSPIEDGELDDMISMLRERSDLVWQV